MDRIVTVLTPTYNRADFLCELYKSLELQTIKKFEWIIVDDGSRDNTFKLVSEFCKEASFHVIYMYKENGGKHSALNEGIKKVTTPLTIIVDSDDRLLPNAIKDIIDLYNKYIDQPDIGVFCFEKCDMKGVPLVRIKDCEFVGSYIKNRIKANKPGDMAEVFRTAVLSQYLFPVFNNEKFLSEDVLWIAVGQKFRFCFKNKAIYQCNYLKNGLSANDKRLKFNSPFGSMMRGKMLMNRECGILQYMKGAIIYDCYLMEAKKIYNNFDNRLRLNLAQKAACYICVPISLFFHWKWSRQLG